MLCVCVCVRTLVVNTQQVKSTQARWFSSAKICNGSFCARQRATIYMLYIIIYTKVFCTNRMFRFVYTWASVCFHCDAHKIANFCVALHIFIIMNTEAIMRHQLFCHKQKIQYKHFLFGFCANQWQNYNVNRKITERTLVHNVECQTKKSKLTFRCNSNKISAINYHDFKRIKVWVSFLLYISHYVSFVVCVRSFLRDRRCVDFFCWRLSKIDKIQLFWIDTEINKPNKCMNATNFTPRTDEDKPKSKGIVKARAQHCTKGHQIYTNIKVWQKKIMKIIMNRICCIALSCHSSIFFFSPLSVLTRLLVRSFVFFHNLLRFLFFHFLSSLLVVWVNVSVLCLCLCAHTKCGESWFSNWSGVS